MSAIDRLQDDHGHLRAALEGIENHLRGNDQGKAVSVLQEACAALAKRLRAHMRRESRLAADCSMVLGKYGPEELALLAVEHDVDQGYLNVILRGLSKDMPDGPERLRFAFEGLIRGLHRHIQEQETSLFPLLMRVFGDQSQVLLVGDVRMNERRTPRPHLAAGFSHLRV